MLTFDKGEKLSAFKAVSCHKRTDSYWGKITALHLAVLNPNPAYLKQVTNYLTTICVIYLQKYIHTF